MDTSPELLLEEALYFQTLIGVMRWMVELGSVNIAVKVSQLALFLVMLRRGHFINALHIMSCLRFKHNSLLALDPSYTCVNQDKFKCDEKWNAFYCDVKEAAPPMERRLLFVCL